MVYDYIDDKTGEIIRRDFPMTGDIPKTIEVEGRTYRRDYGTGRMPAIHIPMHFHDHKFSFNYGPSGRKHFW